MKLGSIKNQFSEMEKLSTELIISIEELLLTLSPTLCQVEITN